jgi:hypothetical protein
LVQIRVVLQAFSDNLRQGLATVFGPPGGVQETAPAAGDLPSAAVEVSLLCLDKLTLTVTGDARGLGGTEYGNVKHGLSPRQVDECNLELCNKSVGRYPAKAAQLRAKTLQKNRLALRELTAGGGPRDWPVAAEPGVPPCEETEAALAGAVAAVRTVQEAAAGAEGRAGELAGAARILATTEGAIGLL